MTFGRRRHRERELREEIESHLRMAVRERVERGEAPEEAERAARREFGNTLLVAETTRAQWGGLWLETLWQDVRYGARTLRKDLGFTAAALVILALGIGANTAVFSVVNAVLLRPLPYENVDDLVLVWGNFLKLDIERLRAKDAEFADYSGQTQVFDDVAAFSDADFTLTDGDRPERVAGARVSTNLFSLLGARPSLGRTFTPEDHRPGRDDVVVLGHGLWRRRFGSDRAVVGKTLLADGRALTVIGVMPPGFEFPHHSFAFTESADLWAPAVHPEDQLVSRSGPYRNVVIARLKTRVTLERARTQMNALGLDFERQHRSYRGPNGEDGGWRITLSPLHEEAVGPEARLALLVLFGAAGFVLLIACANVANLFWVRAVARRKELTVRAALGAGRGRIVRQLLTESLLLALLAGVAGAALARWGVKLLVAFGPENVPRLSETTLDGTVLVFTSAVSLLTGLLFGVTPALLTTEQNLTAALKEASRGLTAGAGRQRLSKGLVVTEVALALVLLVGAGLMLKSFHLLRHRDPGFDPAGVLSVELSLGERYAEDHERAAFYQRLVAGIETLPGVESAGITSHLPFRRASINDPVTVEGRPFDMGDAASTAAHQAVGPDYFRTMRIALRRGRDFSARDGAAEAPRVAIVNEHMARTFWPGQDPVGKRLKLGGPQPSNPWLTIVGVVGDSVQGQLESALRSELYLPHAQAPDPDMFVAIRAAAAGGDPQSLMPGVRAQVAAIDKDQPIINAETVENLAAASVGPQRFQLLLLASFALVAVSLAATGIYGVIAYNAARRAHEIGVRMALGADRRDVIGMVVGQGLRLALAGAAAGLLAAAGLTRLLANMLYGVRATDLVTYAVVTALLIGVAALASYVPARRAAGTDPRLALRDG